MDESQEALGIGEIFTALLEAPSNRLKMEVPSQEEAGKLRANLATYKSRNAKRLKLAENYGDFNLRVDIEEQATSIAGFIGKGKIIVTLTMEFDKSKLHKQYAVKILPDEEDI